MSGENREGMGPEFDWLPTHIQNEFRDGTMDFHGTVNGAIVYRGDYVSYTFLCDRGNRSFGLSRVRLVSNDRPIPNSPMGYVLKRRSYESEFVILGRPEDLRWVSAQMNGQSYVSVTVRGDSADLDALPGVAFG